MITLQLSMNVIMLVYKAYLIVQDKMAHEIIELGVKSESAKNRTRTLVPTLVVGSKR